MNSGYRRGVVHLIGSQSVDAWRSDAQPGLVGALMHLIVKLTGPTSGTLGGLRLCTLVSILGRARGGRCDDADWARGVAVCINRTKPDTIADANDAPPRYAATRFPGAQISLHGRGSSPGATSLQRSVSGAGGAGRRLPAGENRCCRRDMCRVDQEPHCGGSEPDDCQVPIRHRTLRYRQMA